MIYVFCVQGSCTGMSVCMIDVPCVYGSCRDVSIMYSRSMFNICILQGDLLSGQCTIYNPCVQGSCRDVNITCITCDRSVYNILVCPLCRRYWQSPLYKVLAVPCVQGSPVYKVLAVPCVQGSPMYKVLAVPCVQGSPVYKGPMCTRVPCVQGSPVYKGSLCTRYWKSPVYKVLCR